MKLAHIRKMAFVAIIVLTMGLIGCVTQPVYNVEQSSINASSSVSMAKVKKAIVSAGAERGWSMKEVKPGHLVATLFARKHKAVVDIRYSKKNYSITYNDSVALKYDGEKIHKRYNGWIMNLDRQIQIRLSSL
jgi:hypothetical protein